MLHRRVRILAYLQDLSGHEKVTYTRIARFVGEPYGSVFRDMVWFLENKLVNAFNHITADGRKYLEETRKCCSTTSFTHSSSQSL